MDSWGTFPQPGELPDQRTWGATCSVGKDPNLHLSGDGCSQGKEDHQAVSEKEGLFLWGLQTTTTTTTTPYRKRKIKNSSSFAVYKAGDRSQGTSENLCSTL